MSVYVHIPFCDRKCAFCDCYAIRAGNIAGGIAEQYALALLMEIEAWGRIMPLPKRTVTTVHFGGGTADYLGAEWFARIVEQLKRTLVPGGGVEWALETTSTQLTDKHRSELFAWGFRRLHVGVQTLEEPLRQEIGRKESATEVLNKLARAKDDGFIVSVDLIYGLPGQTVSGFCSDLERLADCGVHGFSVYQLNSTSRNRRFADKHNTAGRDPFRDYLFFQLAEQLLRQYGYKKNHFAHFARTEDRNLYYTHARRGEDLLALGTTADGILGDFRYRHPEMRQYLRNNGPARPALEGGVWENSRERSLRPITAGLMSGEIEQSLLLKVAPSGLPGLWLDAGLIEEKAGKFNLLANGSWFIGEMLAQLAGGEESICRNRVDLIKA
jgi:oxygen-independent coproporphyrinogen-3 oxidase